MDSEQNFSMWMSGRTRKKKFWFCISQCEAFRKKILEAIYDLVMLTIGKYTLYCTYRMVRATCNFSVMIVVMICCCGLIQQRDAMNLEGILTYVSKKPRYFELTVL